MKTFSWPIQKTLALVDLDLDTYRPPNKEQLFQILGDIRFHIDKYHGSTLTDHSYIIPLAKLIRDASNTTLSPEDRKQMIARSEHLEMRHCEERLLALTTGNEDLTLYVGELATWMGRPARRMLSSFACKKEMRITAITHRLSNQTRNVDSYLKTLHPDLKMSGIPRFSATSLFFMAGEGNTHPKHVAYFMPEDEGKSRPDFARTIYFSNVHTKILEAISYPLFRGMTGYDAELPARLWEREDIAVAGFYSHEIGHCVGTMKTNFEQTRKTDRWISITFQEICADVFGILIFCEQWTTYGKFTVRQALEYYLAECLRYTHRGSGIFPDSDGMLFQLNYLHHIGALSFDSKQGRLKLAYDPPLLIAGLRSLGRQLTETALSGNIAQMTRLFLRYGPDGTHALDELVRSLATFPPMSISYQQTT